MKFSSFGKFILSGEHFVLYGIPTIALPWRSVRLHLTREVPSSEEMDTELREKLLAAWNRAREFFSLPPDGEFPFTIESEIPIGAGFGSSAALCLCLLEAAREEAGAAPLPLKEKIARARELEDLFHGRSSGLDPAVIAYGRPIVFSTGGEISPIQWRFPHRSFILALSSKPRQTAEAVARVARFSREFPSRFSEILSEMSKISNNLLETIEIDDINNSEKRAAEMGRLLCDNHRLLREVGVSCRELDDLVDSALKAGAWGAKLTGAGMGGGVLAYCPPDLAGEIEEALMGAGARAVYRYTIGGPEVKSGEDN